MFAGTTRCSGAATKGTPVDALVPGVHPSFLEHAAVHAKLHGIRTEILIEAGRPSLPEDR
ncbi:MAG: hypothetical protein FWE39_04815 [Nocardiaceae bacterium]|nr:hypothetical protein [Nocardiaceae bacterium]